MRKINKPPEHIIHFNVWAKSQNFRDWSQFSAPQSEYHPIYLEVRDHIAIMEQSCLSSYTEKPLGSNIHIDHFRKKGLFHNKTFDYENFLVDDLNDNYGACFKDNHAGVTKESFDGEERIFCPVTENMAELITYTFNGAMLPKEGLSETDSKRVSETIRVFNLNHRSLKLKRSDLLRLISDYRSYGLPDETIREAVTKNGFPSLVNWVLLNRP